MISQNWAKYLYQKLAVVKGLTWSANCVVSAATGAETFAITDTKLFIFQ